MISPFVRRLRLASELRRLRTEAGLTHDQLARRIGQSRAQISRLENGHIVDQADVLAILDTLGVDGERWTQIVTIAREAGERGWWEYHRAMGERQKRYADLEAGATTIREYQQNFIPGLLQTPEFVRARTDAAAELEPMAGISVDAVLAGRAGRQRMLRRPGAPCYQVVIDEVAIRRLSAPPEVVTAQLHHLAAIATSGNTQADRTSGSPLGSGQVTLQVLPVDARIDSYTVPRSAFSIYTYSDPGDSTVVAVDTITDDLLLTSPDAVDRYQQLYQRLHDAALSQLDSVNLLTKAAAEMDRR
jgi:transcriptional regulator with XRE-family HTH domain